ncbi:protein of unknown function [Paraburkholderia dioscoreae]|uniref:Uncharacterized protein n=1 Tax=Paraburkholderia dioscoreae TaxID=2604047 RepID=A0A5Q4Z9K1_9BURK|nr:protein of unknown function [Paraburkholderia dioscoreae]
MMAVRITWDAPRDERRHLVTKTDEEKLVGGGLNQIISLLLDDLRSLRVPALAVGKGYP